MSRKITLLDKYLRELLQVNTTIKAANELLQASSSAWEAEYLQHMIADMESRKRTILLLLHSSNLLQKSPK
jgi:hypothetical protein